MAESVDGATLFIVIAGNKELSVNNIELIPENAPQLSDLFSDREEGPHQEFKSAETCLVCHKQEMNIPGIGKVPKIPHLEKDNCLECHKLPYPLWQFVI